MATDLYKEAIAEARQLKEMAEQNAKNQIIDAVMPRIKNLIEQQLVGDEEEDPPEDDLFTDDEVSDEMVDDRMTVDLDDLIPADEVDIDLPSIDDDVPMDLGLDLGFPVEDEDDPMISMDVAGDVNIELDDEDEEDTDLILSQEAVNALAKMMSGNKSGKSLLSKKVIVLEKAVKQFGKVTTSQEQYSNEEIDLLRNHYNKLVKEAVNLRRNVILNDHGPGDNPLRRRIQKIIKEMKAMSRSNQLWNLLSEETYNEADLDVEVEATSDDLEALVAAEDEEAVEVALEDMLADAEVSVSLAGAEEGEDEDLEDLEGDEELDLEDIGDEDEADIDLDDPADVLDIDESMLRRELYRLRRLNEEEVADTDPYLNNGGDDEGDVFVDVDEDTLLNALADELGDAPVPSVPGASYTDAMPESYRRRSRRRSRFAPARRTGHRVNESRNNRALKGKLNAYGKAVNSLKKQLSEVNLFNAKLLYANKLMQNRNVTPKQQRAVVEALDGAKTLREAKLLYKSLTASLKRGTKSGVLGEGSVRRKLGSSSRSTRSASAPKSGVEVDRWAVLAGINEDK